MSFYSSIHVHLLTRQHNHLHRHMCTKYTHVHTASSLYLILSYCLWFMYDILVEMKACALWINNAFNTSHNEFIPIFAVVVVDVAFVCGCCFIFYFFVYWKFPGGPKFHLIGVIDFGKKKKKNWKNDGRKYQQNQPQVYISLAIMDCI